MPSWSQSSRWSLRGLFFVTALSVGCGGAEEAGQGSELAQQQQRQEEEPEVKVPRLASLTATAQEELHERSRTLLQATLAPGQRDVTELLLDSDVGEPAVLRDDGKEGDAKAGDGVFSGLGFVNFKAELEQNSRIAEFSQRHGDKLVKGLFDGRELVKQVPLRPRPPEIFKPFTPIPLEPLGISFAIDTTRSLLIRHPSVVNDPTRTYDPCSNTGNPNGVWTFNHLMTEMSNQPLTGITPEAFTRRWLRHWEVAQTVNFWTVPARPNMVPRIITPWPKLPDGSLNMSRSAFKLVAIVNRLDLGKGTAPAGYGGGNGAGELRFVFAAVNRSGSSCSVSPFLVIFEYGVPKTGCSAVKSWAAQWANLSLIALGDPSFNPALEALTQQVVMRNTVPAKPNGNAINQIRTNENLLNPLWELREFRLFSSGPTPNHLSQHTVVLTPGDARNNTADLASFINTNTASILANTYSVPLDWPVVGNNFLGGNSLVPSPITTFWKAPGIVDNNARHKFSFNTCNGCHGGEMGTFFTHISQTGALSPFLSGPFTKTDPVLPAVSRNFNEMLDRQQHLDSVASQSCLVRSLDFRSALVH